MGTNATQFLCQFTSELSTTKTVDVEIDPIVDVIKALQNIYPECILCQIEKHRHLRVDSHPQWDESDDGSGNCEDKERDRDNDESDCEM